MIYLRKFVGRESLDRVVVGGSRVKRIFKILFCGYCCCFNIGNIWVNLNVFIKKVFMRKKLKREKKVIKMGNIFKEIGGEGI